MRSNRVLSALCVSEWLQSRNKIPNKWSNEIRQIRDKINAALAELPLDVKSMLDLSFVGYYQSQRILELLEKAKSDKGEKLKSLFGGYTDNNLRAWDSIVQQYKKGQVFLGECGRVLSQNAHFEMCVSVVPCTAPGRACAEWSVRPLVRSFSAPR